MKESQKQRGNRKPLIYILLVAIISAALFFILKEDEPDRVENFEYQSAPAFTLEGKLSFLSENATDTIKTIDIEVADDNQQRMMGLMYREKMPFTQGMLFIFEEEEPQGFWMRNTRFSLDIMYVDAQMKIIDIHRGTVPFSDASIPSNAPAQYVVEVTAGFSDKFDVNEGDYIAFDLLRKDPLP